MTELQSIESGTQYSQAAADRPQLLCEADIRGYVAEKLRLRQKLLAAVERYGSPLYVVDAEALRRRTDHFLAAFAAEMPGPWGVYAAVKTNNSPEFARIFLERGLGLDVSSGDELAMALELGARDIVFSGPGKTDAELTLALGAADRVTVLIDSFGELCRLEALAAASKIRIRAGVRLTTNPNGLWRKFGIPLDSLREFLICALECEFVHLEGLQFHTSWNLTPRAQVDFIRLLGAELSRLDEKLLARLRFIDIGGGYWPEAGEWLQAAAAPDAPEGAKRCRVPGAPIEHFAAELASAVREYFYSLGGLGGSGDDAPLRICMEPGRWLCQPGMHLLMRVVDKKALDLVVTDAGMNAVGWERFEHDYFPVINLTRPALEEIRCDVLGCLCTPHDVWGDGCRGEDIREGDVLLIPDQGAYTYSLRQNFIKAPPKTVVI